MIEAVVSLLIHLMVAAAMATIAAALVLLAIVRFVWQVFCLPARLLGRARS